MRSLLTVKEGVGREKARLKVRTVLVWAPALAEPLPQHNRDASVQRKGRPLGHSVPQAQLQARLSTAQPTEPSQLSAPGPLALDQRGTPCLLAAHCEFLAPGPLHFLCWEKLTDFILFSITTPPITSWQIDGETVETVTDYLGRLQNHCR